MTPQSIVYVTIFLGIIFIFSCTSPVDPGIPHRNVIYHSSFESPQDTVGWTGYAGIRRYEDAAPDGGNYSLLVSGGCPIPHALYEIGPFPRNASLIIEGWGRSLDAGGGVVIQTSYFGERRRRYTGFSIQTEEWTFFQSEEPFPVKKGDVLYIHISAGGIVSGTVLVDLLTVREVN